MPLVSLGSVFENILKSFQDLKLKFEKTKTILAHKLSFPKFGSIVNEILSSEKTLLLYI